MHARHHSHTLSKNQGSKNVLETRERRYMYDVNGCSKLGFQPRVPLLVWYPERFGILGACLIGFGGWCHLFFDFLCRSFSGVD
jgi:hypothetical protein